MGLLQPQGSEGEDGPGATSNSLPGGNAISAVLSKVRASVTVYIYMFYVMFGKAEQFVSIFIFIKCCQP